MASCSYHVPGAIYKVGNEEFDNYKDAIWHAKSTFDKVYQHRLDGRKFLFYSAPAEAKLLKKRKG